MRASILTVLLLIAIVRPARAEAPQLQLAIEPQANQAFTLSVRNASPKAHTFIEFSTNGIWYPAYFTACNINNALLYSAPNTGGIRLFRALQASTIAEQVKASWQRLGVTNYMFQFSKVCICAEIVSATVTVMANAVVKVEDARNVLGEPIANPLLSDAPTINSVFDKWIFSESGGGYARELVFDTNGFPRTFDIDVEPRSVDEEQTYHIFSIIPLQ